VRRRIKVMREREIFFAGAKKLGGFAVLGKLVVEAFTFPAYPPCLSCLGSIFHFVATL
jgi:hypothetical protein